MSGAPSNRDRTRRGGRDWAAGLQWVLDSHLQRLLARARDPGRAGDARSDRRPPMRVSDSDRDRVAEALHSAAVEGRLEPAELAERLEQVWAARTIADLAPAVADLPGEPGVLPDVGSSPTEVSAYFRVARVDGPWEVPRRLPVVVSCGAVVLDLTRATVRTPEVVLDLAVTLGTVDVTVPPGVVVHIQDGLTVFGSWSSRARVRDGVRGGAAPPGGHPVVRIIGTVVGGRVSVAVGRGARGRRRDR